LKTTKAAAGDDSDGSFVFPAHFPRALKIRLVALKIEKDLLWPSPDTVPAA